MLILMIEKNKNNLLTKFECILNTDVTCHIIQNKRKKIIDEG